MWLSSLKLLKKRVKAPLKIRCLTSVVSTKDFSYLQKTSLFYWKKEFKGQFTIIQDDQKPQKEEELEWGRLQGPYLDCFQVYAALTNSANLVTGISILILEILRLEKYLQFDPWIPP